MRTLNIPIFLCLVTLCILGASSLGFAQDVRLRYPIGSCPNGVVISAYYDQNSGSGYKDWNCKTKSYNGHNGTDYAPKGGFSTACEVVAAADGEVVSMVDGLFDERKSAGSSNADCSNGNSYGNYVKVKHRDGQHVVYAHMKKNSIVVKKGQKVTCGQKIGVARSSGCSTGVHLHFDISTNSSSKNRYDPYHGSCSSSTSQWVSQNAYLAMPSATCQCIPNCSGKSCGDNGCGGSCGSCASNQTCQSGKCVCVPNCSGKACGDDGCGGSCGSCASNQTCQSGKCVCVPNCNGKVCGDDGCGGSCGSCSGAQEACQSGKCVCVPNCNGKVCGDDGCGGSCGSCSGAQDVCESGKCVCVPNCEGKVCGDDGCGGSCGSCEGPQDVCEGGACVCVPNCEGKVCGDDGCGGSCGSCEGPQDVCEGGACVCVPNCEGKVCGDDGCGGSCGSCEGMTCTEHGQCVCDSDDDCDDDDVCVDAECVECRNEQAAICDDGKIKKCQDQIYIWEECPENTSCIEGVCEPDAECDAGFKPVCEGNAVKRCSSEGKYILEPCSSDAYCASGKCHIQGQEPEQPTPEVTGHAAQPRITFYVAEACAMSSRQPSGMSLWAFVLGLLGLYGVRRRSIQRRMHEK